MKRKNKVIKEDDQTDSFEQIRKFGTYNIQQTQNTSNLFPFISQGLPLHYAKNDIKKKPKK